MKVYLPGEKLRFPYVNYRGVEEVRTVIFRGLDFGDNEWYPERQWFMRTWDTVRNGDRSFALAKIDPDKIEIIGREMTQRERISFMAGLSVEGAILPDTRPISRHENPLWKTADNSALTPKSA